MSNEIRGLSSRSPVEGARVVARREPGQGTSRSGAAADSVSLTEAALLLQEAEASARDMPDVDAERVETIKQAIADGSYRIDARRVAEQVLRMEDLLPR